MKQNQKPQHVEAPVAEALAQLMRDENAWVGQEWNAAWEKLKKDLYQRKLVQ